MAAEYLLDAVFKYAPKSISIQFYQNFRLIKNENVDYIYKIFEIIKLFGKIIHIFGSLWMKLMMDEIVFNQFKSTHQSTHEKHTHHEDLYTIQVQTSSNFYK